jgi:hypothetical protein
MVRKECVCTCKSTMNNDILYRRSCLPVNPYAGGACVGMSLREEVEGENSENESPGRGLRAIGLPVMQVRPWH